MTTNDEKPASKEELRRRYQEEQADSKPTPPKDWQSLIEEQISKLNLDNLPGKGTPLNLERNPYMNEGDELAHNLLKNAGYTLPWIDDSKRIDADIAAARAKLARAHTEYLHARDVEMCAGPQWIEGAWLAAVREFRQEAARINRAIRDFNLLVPSARLHKFALLIDQELAPYGVDDD